MKSHSKEPSIANRTPPAGTGRASWQIPAGVGAGTWDYVRSQQIAAGYDQFLKDTPLTQLDWAIISRWLLAPDVERSGKTVAEFGCGTGRTLIPLTRSGYRTVGIDLSAAMLSEMQKKYQRLNQPESAQSKPCPAVTARKMPDASTGHLSAIQANLVELEGIADNSVDHAVCLFSTLGMIQGADHRQKFLRHARRAIRSGGLFILHAHNFWFQLRHPGGIGWMLKHAWEVIAGQMELGDRLASYRNINNMFIHSFRKRELTTALATAGFQIAAWYPIAAGRPAEMLQRDFSNPLATVGWVVVCR